MSGLRAARRAAIGDEQGPDAVVHDDQGRSPKFLNAYCAACGEREGNKPSV
jgi:hypothetical protein